jgi:hypothetical protein
VSEKVQAARETLNINFSAQSLPKVTKPAKENLKKT